jgi:tape measure domain-containing protein
MAEQAYAYVTLIPVAKGFKSAITKELGGVDGVGKTVGDKTGSNFKSSFEKAVKGAFKVVAIGAGVAAAGLSGALAAGFARLSGIEEAQAKLVGLGNSTQSVGLIMENALSAVRGTAFGMADAATIAASAVAAGIQPGEELARYLKITADSAYIAGAGLSEMGSILNKATTTGKANNQVLTQLAERGIPIYQMLGEQAGVSAAEIFELAKTGQISSKMLMDALEGNLGGAALESGNTVAGAFANMNASIARVGANLLGPSFHYFKDFFLGVIAFLDPIEAKAKVVGQAVADLLGNNIIPYFQDLFLIGKVLGADNLFAKVFDDIKSAVTGFFQGGALANAFETISELRMTIFNAVLKAVPGILDAFIEFLPQLIDFFQNTMLPKMLDQFQRLLNDTIALITRLLPGLVSSLLSMVPQLLDAAIQLFNALVEAVIEITPKLVDAIIYLLPEIVQSVLSMLPQILRAAIDLFTAIVMALPKIVPPLINAIIDLLPVIIKTVVDMLPQLIAAAFELFYGIVSALYKATPEIMGAIGELIPKMIGTILGAIPQFLQAGLDIIGGFIEGIVTQGPKLIGDAFAGVIGGAIEGVKGLLGIRSPSRVFQEFGVNIGEGLAAGIESQNKAVETSARGLGSSAKKGFGDSIDEIKEQLTVITNIPSLLSESIEKTADVTISQIRRMAKETEGFFALMDKSGKLLSVYSGYGQDMVLPTAGGGTANLGSLVDDLNSLTKFAGAKTVSEILELERKALGGASLQEAINKISGQVSVITADGQRTIGQTLTPYMEQLIAQGGKLESTEQSIDDLKNAMDNLAAQIKQRGLTPFAKGGLVTGPTSALIGEAGPEVVIPLDRFESMMGMTGAPGKTVNYFAAPNQSIDSEQALFQAMRRAKVVANW